MQTTTLILHSFGNFFVSLVDQTYPIFVKHLQASIEMSFDPVTFLAFILTNAFFTSATLVSHRRSVTLTKYPLVTKPPIESSCEVC